MTTTAIEPIGIATLAPGFDSCGTCGQPVPMPAPVEEFRITARMNGNVRMPFEASVQFPTCATCQARTARAEQIVAEHPALAHRIGAPAAWQVENALIALDAAGVAAPEQMDDRVLASLITRLSALGVRWSSRYSPVMHADARAGQAASSPWLWLDSDRAADIRRAVASWQADRMPPRPIREPGGGYCAWCGTVTVLGRVSESLWQTVNGAGVLCRDCYAVQREHNAVGEGIVEAAFVEWLSPASLHPNFALGGTLSGVRPAPGPQPSPWHHLGGEAEFDALREVLRRGY